MFLLISCPAELEHFPSQGKKNPTIINAMATGSLNEKKVTMKIKRKTKSGGRQKQWLKNKA